MAVALTKRLHERRRIPGLAIASMVAAGLLSGCSSSSPTQSARSTAICPASPMVNSGKMASGFGAGPVYLSGQSGWYSGGQTAVLMVDSAYTGPLLVRAFQLDGAGTAQITLADLPPTDLVSIAAKESRDSVTVVSAVHRPEGGLELAADPGSPSWRAWFGRLSTSGPGCFALQLDGAAFSEVIVVDVHGGPPPPG
jgi:hypothetical protein